MSSRNLEFFIGGRWVGPKVAASYRLINPATEAEWSEASLGDAADVDQAVAAAKAAFLGWSRTSLTDRIRLLSAASEIYRRRSDELAGTITREMGCPLWLSKAAQVAAGATHLDNVVRVAQAFEFTKDAGTTRIYREPIGVVGLITPWNWPMNQIMAKVAPALAAGCTIVLKPSEYTPLSAITLAEILEEAGLPPGVFNLINGTGSAVGEAVARHPDIDMVSFTGSTRAGVAVAKLAADTVKKVTQELGGKSANIILDDAPLAEAVTQSVELMMLNSGQNCNAPSRMFVPARLHDEAVEAAAVAAAKAKVGDPLANDTAVGPVANGAQFERVQGFIQAGLDEGARLAAGGLGRPSGIDRGYFVRPTIFAGVSNGQKIAREEIFGPVMCIIPYEAEAEAVAMANDSKYGLSGYVSSSSTARAKAVAEQLRTGNVHLNLAPGDMSAPFGGYKQSGNGREWGPDGLEEFLEKKAVLGYGSA